MNLPLFDQKPAETADVKVTSAALHSAPIASDVVRVIEHQVGPFLWVVTTPDRPREHRIVELQDGTYHVELIDNGERHHLTWRPDEIEQNLKSGNWREVSRG